ncbi:MAG TPA: GAF domain-containing protein, partial [Solirubrobacteraceae bacterium]|nr:GAF domain-containing protein [Solirubrobacteraceae bacterium]
MTDAARPDGIVSPAVLGVLENARGVLSDLDLDVVLERLVESAREVSGARYAALGVLDESRTGLERFITAGIDEPTRRGIGELPKGRGVLGQLITDPVTLRLEDVGAHPRSYGFPPGHPPMRTFLGVSVVVCGQPFANLYLSEKAGGEQFSEQDEQIVELLAGFAAAAIDHAQRYTGLDARHTELRRKVDALDATLQIARALGGETDLERILEMVAKRGRALVSARLLVIEHEQAEEMLIVAGAGDLPAGLVGQRLELPGSLASAALRGLRTLRVEDEPNRTRFERHGLGRLGVRADAGLVVPLLFRGQAHGVLIALDRLQDGPAFTADDQRLLEAFAASAATAIATAETGQAERHRQRLAAAEEERARWARELHDETLQSLAAVRLGLVAQLKHPSLEVTAEAVRGAVAQLEQEIASLRSLITDLRPAALDELGAEAAITDLAERTRQRGFAVDLAIDLAYEQGRRSDRHPIELETAMYRIVQEALNNAHKHGQAQRARVQIEEGDHSVRVTVRDDGRGFDAEVKTNGFGLLGIHERAQLVGGTVEIQSSPGEGTTVTATLPT